MQDRQDGITIGDLVTESFLNNGTINGEAIGKIYNLVLRSDLTAQSEDVKNTGSSDTSNVYQVVQSLNQTYGALDVSIQDSNAASVDYYFQQEKIITNPTVSYPIGSTVIIVGNATGITTSDTMTIRTANKMSQHIIKNISSNTLTIFPGTDYAIDTNTEITLGTVNMNVNGSVTPIEFVFRAPSDEEFDIYTMNFAILDQTAMDDKTFGGLTQLTNGLILKTINDEETETHWVLFNNAGFKHRDYDVKYSDKAPAGYYGISGSKSIRLSNGVAKIVGGDKHYKIILRINDNLTNLDEFFFTANGHKKEKLY